MAASVRGQQPQQPAGTAPVDMVENAVVQQIEWYMGRQNLATDYFLKQKMDADLWVPLSVIMSFPKMQMLQVTDPGIVASLLERASTLVEVDPSRTRIRPAWARWSTLAVSVTGVTAASDIEALFGEDSNSPSPFSTVLVAPAEGLWHCTFAAPEDAAVALEVIRGLTIGAENVHAQVLPSGLQSVLVGAPIAGPGAVMAAPPGIPPSPPAMGTGFFDGSGGSMQGMPMGVGYGAGVPPGMIAPHMPLPMQGVPGSPNYGYMSGGGFPGTPVVGGNGYGQSAFVPPSQNFVPSNYYVHPYPHQGPYDQTNGGVQQHAAPATGSAVAGGIAPTVQMQEAEAAARAAAEAGQAAGNVNPGGIGSIPKVSGGPMSHHAVSTGAIHVGPAGAVGTGVIEGSSHQGHPRGQQAGRRNSQRHPHIQPHHPAANGAIGAANGYAYYPQSFEGAPPHAGRGGQLHSAKGVVPTSAIAGGGVSLGVPMPNKTNYGQSPGGVLAGVSRGRATSQGGGAPPQNGPLLAGDSGSHPHRVSKVHGGLILDGSSRPSSMAKKSKKKVNNRQSVGSSNGTGVPYSGVSGIESRGPAESSEGLRDDSRRSTSDDDRKSDDSKAAFEPNFTAMHFPPLPGASENVSSNKSSPSTLAQSSPATGVPPMSAPSEAASRSVVSGSRMAAPCSKENATPAVSELASGNPPVVPESAAPSDSDVSSAVDDKPGSVSIGSAAETPKGATGSIASNGPATPASSGGAAELRQHGADGQSLPSVGLTYAEILRAKARKPAVPPPSLSAATSPVSGGHSESSPSGSAGGASGHGHSDGSSESSAGTSPGTSTEVGPPGAYTAAKGHAQNRATHSASGHGKAATGVSAKPNGAAKSEGALQPSVVQVGTTTPVDTDTSSAITEAPKAANSTAVGPKAPRSVWANKPQSVLQAAAVVKVTTGKVTSSSVASSRGVASALPNGTAETGVAASGSSAASPAVSGSVARTTVPPATTSQVGTPASKAPSSGGAASADADSAVGVAGSRAQAQGKPQHPKFQHRGFRATANDGAGSKTSSMSGNTAPKGVWGQGPKVWGKDLAHEKVGAKADP